VSTDLAGLIERARAGVEAAKADPTRAPTSDRDALQRVAQQFEALLLTQMLREMRRAGEWDKDADQGEPGMGLGTESFTEAIDAELGLYLARSSGLGLTSQLIQGLDRLAGGSRNPGAADVGDEAGTLGTPSLPDPANSVAASRGKVTSGFGWRSDPFTGQASFHRGLDLEAAYGQDVQAAAAGRVVFSGEQRGYGTTVVVEHADGSRSRYAHLSVATVETGTAVGAGQELGRAGNSGRARGTHLHFEVTGPEGEPISPGQWMQRWADTPEA
jgi:murein DD-endopeptidase MepM/ murein hydrolase activator NlpD